MLLDIQTDRNLILFLNHFLHRNPIFKDIPKGIWIWNRREDHFVCSYGFCKIMNTSFITNPDFDFWVEILAPDDLISFVDALEGVLHDSRPRNFMIWRSCSNEAKRII